jgi:hypothetical protein
MHPSHEWGITVYDLKLEWQIDNSYEETKSRKEG